MELLFLTLGKNQKKTEFHDFIKYLVYWVAGTKLIFICLLVVVVIFGTYEVKIMSLLVLVFSILTFYYKLYPIIKELDKKDLITPKGYSRTLNLMILSFIFTFSLTLIMCIFTKQ